ncbi:MAG: SRPBCC family protein [Polyangia bacterium]
MDKRSVEKALRRAAGRLHRAPVETGAGAGFGFLGGLGVGLGLALTFGPGLALGDPRPAHGKRRDGSHSPDDESVRQSRLTPGLRLLLGGAGCALLGLCTARRDAAARAAGFVGAGLLASAFLRRPPWHIVGVGAGRRAVDLHTTVDVEAPLGEVFAFYRNFQNFPRFMQHVREITVLDDRLSHWKVAGPAGKTVEWDVELTVCLPNERIGWKTPPHQSVEHAGTVHFEPLGERRTRLDVRMSYNPPAGALGHVVARLFQVDPKTSLDEDLARLKALLEKTDAPATQAPMPGTPPGSPPDQPVDPEGEIELEPDIEQIIEPPPPPRAVPPFDPLPEQPFAAPPEPPGPPFDPPPGAMSDPPFTPPFMPPGAMSDPPFMPPGPPPAPQFTPPPGPPPELAPPGPDINAGWVAEPMEPPRSVEVGPDERAPMEAMPGEVPRSFPELLSPPLDKPR